MTHFLFLRTIVKLRQRSPDSTATHENDDESRLISIHIVSSNRWLATFLRLVSGSKIFPFIAM
jgi:hypothetical protein